MTILVVEDNPEKCKEIVDFLQEIGNVSFEMVQEYVQARSIIKKKSYDFLILDMSLRRAKDTQLLRTYAGKELLFDMLDEDIAIPTVVLTGYLDFEGGSARKYKNVPTMLPNNQLDEPSDEDLEKKYDISTFEGIHEYLCDKIPFYLGIIYFQYQHNEWKNALKKIMEQIKEKNEHFTFRESGR